MVGHMEPAVADFKKLFADGILTTDALDVTPAERSKMLYQKHSTAMIIECQNALSYEQTMLENARASTEEENTDSVNRRGKGERQVNTATESEETEIVDHEIAMMPFWTSDSANGDFLYAIPSYYMAINKASAEESDEKKQILLDIYSYLSSVEGQEMLIGDGFQMSSIEGVALNENDFSKDILATIAKGQVINTFSLAEGEDNKQVERQLLSGVGDLVENRISVTNWLSSADAVRDDQLTESIEQEEASYGQVETTLTRLETAYTVAQMYQEETGAQIGLCRAGGWSRSTNGYLYGGSITDSSLECITPDKESQPEDEDSDQNKIVTAKMTGKQILDILNSGDVTNTKGTYIYYVAAGLDVKFAPWGGEGERVISCKLPDGSKLDQNATYTVAYFNGSLPDDTIKAEDVLDMTWKDAFLEWLDARDGKVEKPDMTLTLVYE
jgi:hypothetical protein